MRVVAGIDTSTQSTTVLLRDADTGVVLGVGRSPHPPTSPPVSEQDPADWWSALVAAFASARAEGGVAAEQIVGISVAGQCHGLVALDEHGGVIRKAKLWNDTTSAPQAAALERQFGVERLMNRLGSLPPAAFTITKIAWLAEHEPDNFARLATVLLPHDWLTFRMTGNRVTDRSEASGTGYFDATTDEYEYEFLRWIDADRDWERMLPTVLGPADSAGTVLPEIAAELGVSPDAVVGAGAGDQHAGAIGLGASHGDIVYVLGTSGVVYGISDTPVIDPAGLVNCVAGAAGGFQPLICTLNATKVTDAFARLLGVTHQELSDLALAAPRTTDRPVLAAYLDGERTPNLPEARGALSGFGSDISREQFALAAFEGVALGLLRGEQALVGLGMPDSGRLLVIGGGSKSEAYLQVISDLTGRDVQIVDEAEAVAAGAAVQAAAVLRGDDIAQIRDAWAPSTTPVASPRTDPSAPAVAERYDLTAQFAGAAGQQ